MPMFRPRIVAGISTAHPEADPQLLLIRAFDGVGRAWTYAADVTRIWRPALAVATAAACWRPCALKLHQPA